MDWAQCRPPGQAQEEGRALLLGEVNAAIDGALSAGATEIVCNDAHGTTNNLRPTDPHGRAAYVTGRHKPRYMTEGLDDSFDAVFFVGYHGSVSGEPSVLSHTYNPSVISRVNRCRVARPMAKPPSYRARNPALSPAGPGLPASRRWGLVAPLTRADRPEAPPLRLVECQVAANRDGDC